jgi:RNA polymerase sigma-70 factor (ECF subfamily)
MLHQLLPDAGETGGLLALLLLVDARRGSRESETGELVLLSRQDRDSWDREQIAEGIDILTQSLQRFPPGRYGVQAAIAAIHAEAPEWASTDWVQIAELYDLLWRLWPTPVVALNRAVAVGFRDGPQAGHDALEPLLNDPVLATYGYLRAAQADFLRQLERWSQAKDAYAEALALTANVVEKNFLIGRIKEIQVHLP